MRLLPHSTQNLLLTLPPVLPDACRDPPAPTVIVLISKGRQEVQALGIAGYTRTVSVTKPAIASGASTRGVSRP